LADKYVIFYFFFYIFYCCKNNIASGNTALACKIISGIKKIIMAVFDGPKNSR